MSRMLPGEQVEHAFNSKRLKNWEVPATDKWEKANTTMRGTASQTRFDTMRARKTKTTFIVDERGHLLSTVSKLNNSFNHPPSTPAYMSVPPRWPKANPAIPHYGNSTMGYKGIQTSYLPTGTVTIRAADIPGTRERNYNFL